VRGIIFHSYLFFWSIDDDEERDFVYFLKDSEERDFVYI